jgi:hypothetical protein
MCAWVFALSRAEIRKVLIKCGPIYTGLKPQVFWATDGRPEGRPFKAHFKAHLESALRKCTRSTLNQTF